MRAVRGIFTAIKITEDGVLMKNHILLSLCISIISVATFASLPIAEPLLKPKRMNVNDCKIVIEKTLELQMNGSTDPQLNKLLQVIGGECQLTEPISDFTTEPVYFNFVNSDFKIL